MKDNTKSADALFADFLGCATKAPIAPAMFKLVKLPDGQKISPEKYISRMHANAIKNTARFATQDEYNEAIGKYIVQALTYMAEHMVITFDHGYAERAAENKRLAQAEDKSRRKTEIPIS